jgi:methylphosphotriester-DNA--protein-cysteine methyltransferase
MGMHFFIIIFGMDRRESEGMGCHLFQAQKLFKRQEFMIYNELYRNVHLRPNTSQASNVSLPVPEKPLSSGARENSIFFGLWQQMLGLIPATNHTRRQNTGRECQNYYRNREQYYLLRCDTV